MTITTRDNGGRYCPGTKGVFPCGWGTPTMAGLAVALCFACEPGGPDEPEPAVVSVHIQSAEGLEASGSLRLAAVWRVGSGTKSRFITTADVPVESVNATQTLSIQLPPKAERQLLSERSDVYIECSNDSGYFESEVVKPHLVIYEDTDKNGIFQPELPNAAGPDRVWAATRPVYGSPTLVAFSDLDHSLSQEPMEIAECVRVQTQGRYTAFFMANDNSSYVTPVVAPFAMALQFSSTDYPWAALGCEDYVPASHSSFASTTYAARKAFVDPRVQGEACTNSPYPCSVAEVASNLPADITSLEYPGYERSFQCMVSGSLDVLWMTESTLNCKDCDCEWTEIDAAWVVDSAAAPENWPCGVSLKYCTTPEDSLWKPASYCGGSALKRPR